MDTIETLFLCEHCQPPEKVAHYLADFLKSATRSIDFCAYSFHLKRDLREIVASTLRERASAGVKIRIAYDAGTQQDEIQVDPHYKADVPVAEGGDALTTPDFVRSLGFPCRAIEGDRTLMHHKYIVLDADTPDARVWTGSANFTDESWTLQENNILTIRSQKLAGYYAYDFEQLWVDSHIEGTGMNDSGEATLEYGGELAHTLINFSPGEGEWMDELIANQIDRTNERLTVAAVVVTSTRILNALLRLKERGVPIEGIYDYTQMEGVKYQWRQVPPNHWKPGAWEELVQYGNLAGKKSIPYTPTSIHDYMHNKVMVLDDVVITGSYNFSRHAQRNAENLLLIRSEALAATYRDYIHGLMERYGGGRKTTDDGRRTTDDGRRTIDDRR
ncbi:MAG TPA: phospholipase D-like domain-containing protein [Chloroflexia bacterium]|nr:phospholipase D-like domain-containing protein [Chloroflexia bacterium]